MQIYGPLPFADRDQRTRFRPFGHGANVQVRHGKLAASPHLFRSINNFNLANGAVSHDEFKFSSARFLSKATTKMILSIVYLPPLL
jgi:hypothetical protein